MLKIENTEVVGWEHAIRGMRNPKNSWDKSDIEWIEDEHYEVDDYIDEGWEEFFEGRIHKVKIIGPNDLDLMTRLRNAGTDHRKFMRMIVVYCDITAPLYWWKEFDTYAVGVVKNSCSTMHMIHAKEFTLDDFSHEHLARPAINSLYRTIDILNIYRKLFVNWDEIDDNTKNALLVGLDHSNGYDKKDAWWQMIQLVPDSYNQKRTVMTNYEVLANQYKPTSRRYHKQDEWRIDYCNWIKTLPYSELITGKEEK
jgi:hypothetical protein